MSPSISSVNQRQVSSKRSTLPQQLPGATNFSEDGYHAHPKWFIETLKAHPQFWAPLREATDVDHQFGRKRIAGHWALVYLAFVVSRHVDVEPWWKTANSSIWRTAGFRERPSLRAVQRRFAELEELEDEFLKVANAMIAHAVKRSGGRVGQDLHVDSTESETHARLQHICPPDSACHQAKAKVVSATLTADEAREHRHQEADTPDDEVINFSAGDVDDVTFAEPADPSADQMLGRRVKKVKIGGCWYRCLDADAGIRAYTRGGKTKRFWVGYYNGKAIDHYTGAPVAVLVHSASINESAAYPELYRLAKNATGKAPRAVVADRGYSLASVFEHNTRRGVATVAQWRRKHASITDRAQEATDRWDQHGIVRCRYCGGPTRQIRFNVSEHRSSPRMWVKCEEAADGSLCATSEQTINCSEEWRMLIPLWRTTETYLALEDSARSFERVHHLWRRRYRVGSDNHELRPKRRGRACQQLRANVALMAEWLHIMWREGWLGSARRNKSLAVTDQGRKAADSLAAKRSLLGLDKPYGTVAVKLKIGPFRPKPPPG